MPLPQTDCSGLRSLFALNSNHFSLLINLKLEMLAYAVRFKVGMGVSMVRVQIFMSMPM